MVEGSDNRRIPPERSRHRLGVGRETGVPSPNYWEMRTSILPQLLGNASN
jgi:hypothetical protein